MDKPISQAKLIKLTEDLVASYKHHGATIKEFECFVDELKSGQLDIYIDEDKP